MLKPDVNGILYPPAECRNIIGSVYGTRRGVRVRQVPPAEESAKSAAKKRQCYRRHRSKERDECATREPKGAWTTGGHREGDVDYRSGKRELQWVFYLI